MKTSANIILIILGLFIFSCEENFSPKADFKEKCVMTCVLTNNPYVPLITVTVNINKTYDVEGVDPSVNTKDPTVNGAKVYIELPNGSLVNIGEDTVTTRKKDTVIIVKNKYGNPKTYYGGNFATVLGKLKLNALLPDGTVLTGETTSIDGIYFNYSYSFPHGITSKINQWKYGDFWGIYWDTREFHTYFQEFSLSYYKRDKDGNNVYGTVKIPAEILTVNGKPEPVYPEKLKPGKIEIKFTALDYLMNQISDGDQEKSSYYIGDIIMRVVEYDDQLSKYYTSINGYMDDFSIRLDQSVYTNIKGGLGIFGFMRINELKHPVDKEYIHSFGYKQIGEL